MFGVTSFFIFATFVSTIVLIGYVAHSAIMMLLRSTQTFCSSLKVIGKVSSKALQSVFL